jgi:hypothetical protein
VNTPSSSPSTQKTTHTTSLPCSNNIIIINETATATITEQKNEKKTLSIRWIDDIINSIILFVTIHFQVSVDFNVGEEIEDEAFTLNIALLKDTLNDLRVEACIR